MSRKNKQHGKQFKLDTIQYVKEHPDLTQAECCKNLGIGLSTLSRWQQQYKALNVCCFIVIPPLFLLSILPYPHRLVNWIKSACP